MFLVHDRGVVLVDAPPTIGDNLTNAFRQVTQKPLTHLVYSHSHGDHIGGAAQAVTTARKQHPEQNVQIIGHRRTAALLAEKWPSVTELGGPRPTPTVTFAKGKTLRVGRHTLRLEHRGANHSPDNLFIWAPQQKVLMLVDVLFPGWTPFKDLAFSEDIPGWFRAHDQALGYPFQKVVAGHVARVGTRADAIVQREYIHDLRDATLAAVAKVDFRDIAKALGTNNAWAIFDAYYAEVARVAADAVTPKWIDRLGAVDIFTDDHALTLTAAVRLD
jgi:glyoxylase-like metal-dependent hydrolase (beta-lactamase superfamily II)